MTETSSAAHALFDRDEIREVLETSFYRPEVAHADEVAPKARPSVARAGRRKARKPKPDHYEVICISMYREDLDALDAKVADLKARGHRKMSRSSLIRYALENVDLTKLPRSY